jgi:SAM-dependent methyltransferase
MSFAGNLDAARAYDSWFDAGWGAYAFRVESRALLRAAGAVDGLRVLEAGCGTGRMTEILARRGARAAGLDIDAAMLAVAAQHTSAPLILGDAAALPIRAATFDLAIAVTLCEFVDAVPAVFAELARVVRPGGRFIVGSLNPGSLWGWFGRSRFKEAPWTSARFLSRRELLELGSRHGSASITGVLFAPEGLPRRGWLGPALEAAGKLAPLFGAFQVLTVTLPA